MSNWIALNGFYLSPKYIIAIDNSNYIGVSIFLSKKVFYRNETTSVVRILRHDNNEKPTPEYTALCKFMNWNHEQFLLINRNLLCRRVDKKETLLVGLCLAVVHTDSIYSPVYGKLFQSISPYFPAFGGFISLASDVCIF